MFGLQLPGHFSRGGPVAPTSHRARLSHPAGGGSRLPEAATSQSGDAGALGSEHRPRPGGCVPGRESPRQAPAAAVSPTHTSHQRGRAREVFTPPPPVCQSVSQSVSLSTAARGTCGPRAPQSQLVRMTACSALTRPTGDVQLLHRLESLPPHTTSHQPGFGRSSAAPQLESSQRSAVTPRTRKTLASGRRACWELKSSTLMDRGGVILAPPIPLSLEPPFRAEQPSKPVSVCTSFPSALWQYEVNARSVWGPDEAGQWEGGALDLNFLKT